MRRVGAPHRAAPAVTALSRRDRAPLGIPNLVTTGVDLKGFRVHGAKGETLYHHLILLDWRLTGVAHFSGPWAGPESFRSVVRQAAVLKLLADERTDRLNVDGRVVVSGDYDDFSSRRSTSQTWKHVT